MKELILNLKDITLFTALLLAFMIMFYSIIFYVKEVIKELFNRK